MNGFSIRVGAVAATMALLVATGCAGKKKPDPISSVTGTIAYPQKLALSPEAVAYVRLADITKGDAQGVTVAQTEVKPNGAQAPLAFQLTFKDKVIDPSHDYAIDARIVDRGRLVFISNGKKYPVVTKGHPDSAEIKMDAAGTLR
jgi:putative lipoprotein